MIAWSLSGGGNRGPIQVGAMQALFEAGIKPDFLVGTSAGALNSAFLATDPTLEGVQALAAIWLKTTSHDIFPEGWLTHAIRFLTGADSLNSNTALRDYIARNIPRGVETFRDLKCRLYLTTADLLNAQLFLYGDDPEARLIDAVLASAALPVEWPPIVVAGHEFVDGGVVANVPISIAIDRGADTVYVLDLESAEPSPQVHGVYPIAMRTIYVMLYQQLLYDLERAIRFSKITLHHIYFGDLLPGIPLEDFSHTAEMLDLGYKRTKDYMTHPAPNRLNAPSRSALRPTACPPGAVPYNPDPNLRKLQPRG